MFTVSGTASGCSVSAPDLRPPTGPSHSPTHVQLSPPSESGATDLVLSPSIVTDRHLQSEFHLVLGLAGLSVQSDWSFNYSYKTV